MTNMAKNAPIYYVQISQSQGFEWGKTNQKSGFWIFDLFTI